MMPARQSPNALAMTNIAAGKASITSEADERSLRAEVISLLPDPLAHVAAVRRALVEAENFEIVGEISVGSRASTAVRETTHTSCCSTCGCPSSTVSRASAQAAPRPSRTETLLSLCDPLVETQRAGAIHGREARPGRAHARCEPR
jgi:hypothetical protein